MAKESDSERRRETNYPQRQSRKCLFLTNEREREQYKTLVPHVSERLIELMNDIMLYIQDRVSEPLNEHIHIALTDHIAFAIKRLKQGFAMDNPFFC
ncbi:hypothetical protein GCM10020331_042780 [Ectobacillus funiculus]